jgi:hypothetical protein
MIRQQRDASVLEVPMTVFDRKGLPIFQEQRHGRAAMGRCLLLRE